ncbi:MAG: DUF4276 family protein [Verrucomicrobiota bacterium]|nr:DUF4276 family protein [Verrucomicrobiota bacterium]
MKRLVLLGEGHGEVSAFPILAKRLLREKKLDDLFFIDDKLVRTGNAAGLIKWDKEKRKNDSSKWSRLLRIASRRPNLGGVLAVYDGDARTFPAGSSTNFCPATAAKLMATEAIEAGAGKTFSLAIVFACVEYESWLVAGVESLVGKTFKDGRPALASNVKEAIGEPESHGKKWLERNSPGYRPARDQSLLTELVDFSVVRKKNLRSFARLENALNELQKANESGVFVSTPSA